MAAPPDRADHPHWDREGVHDIYRSWRRVAAAYGDDRMFVTEACSPGATALAFYVRPNETSASPAKSP